MRQNPRCCGIDMNFIHMFDEFRCNAPLRCSKLLSFKEWISMQGSKPCCGQSPVVWQGGNWRCSDCDGLVVFEEKQLELPLTTKTPTKVIPKCECGADKTYGPGNLMHSATMPCPLYKKP